MFHALSLKHTWVTHYMNGNIPLWMNWQRYPVMQLLSSIEHSSSSSSSSVMVGQLMSSRMLYTPKQQADEADKPSGINNCPWVLMISWFNTYFLALIKTTCLNWTIYLCQHSTQLPWKNNWSYIWTFINQWPQHSLFKSFSYLLYLPHGPSNYLMRKKTDTNLNTSSGLKS